MLVDLTWRSSTPWFRTTSARLKRHSLALQQATKPEVKDLALAIIEAQLREIGQMRAWRLSWGTGSTGVVSPRQLPRPACTRYPARI